MAKLVPINEVEFKTQQGHVLKPGDPAIAVTTCTNSGHLRIGKYLGVRTGGYGWRNSDCVVMEVQRTRSKLVHKDTGVEYDFKAENKLFPYSMLGEYPYPSYWFDKAATAAYEERMKAYQEASQKRNAGIKELRKDYVYKDFPYLGRTTLYRNNIYPADIALRDVTL